MKAIILGILCILLAPQLSAQTTTWVVDGINGPIYSISSAASSANAGDTIEVWGMKTSGGQPLAYTNTNTIPETFPIPIKAGVTVTGVGDPVYIWPDGQNPTSIFNVAGGGGNTTGMSDLRIGGGQIGIKLVGLASSSFTFNRIVFSGNQVGLSAIQGDGGMTNITLSSCKIVDATQTGLPGTSQTPRIGFQFHAIEGSNGIPIVNVDVNNLTTSGPFTTIGTTSYFLDPDLKAINNGTASHLLQAYARGTTLEHANSTPQPIAEVNLNVNGGVLNAGGNAQDNTGGWDIGIYSAVQSESNSPDSDYSAGTTVTVTGTTLNGFNLTGIYGTAFVMTRGLVELRGQTTVTNTGHLATHVPGSNIHSGVHMYCYEGYLGLTAADTNIVENAGNGIFLNCPGTAYNAIPGIELGLFLGLLRCKIHENGGCGLEMHSSVPNPFNGQSQGGIVGGTRTQDFFANTKLNLGNPLASLPTGQGVVADTAISNNGEVGVRIEVEGGHGEEMAFCRFSNCFIWNNPNGGFYGHCTSSDDWDLGFMLTPILHSTLAGNGDAVGWNVEFDDDVTGNTPMYIWRDPVPPNNVLFVTEIANSIFQRQNSTDFDFGLELHAHAVASVSTDFQQSPAEIALGGIRASLNPFGGIQVLALEKSTSQQTSFSGIGGAVTWTVLKAKQFFLSAGVHPDFLEDPFWGMHTSSPELADDYSGDPRPLLKLDWDKGGEEQ